MYTPPTRIEQIHSLIFNSGSALTRRQIADKIGLQVTPYLINMIERLWLDGKIQKWEAPSSRNKNLLVYSYSATRDFQDETKSASG